jgi:transcriptional regulator with XRE-family HTH domain
VTTAADPRDFGNRLRLERARLHLSQSAVALAAGIAKSTQVAYELGTRTPNIEYVHGLSALGFDVWHVLYGVRSERRASQVFNWDMLKEIHEAIRAWCERKELELTPGEEMDLAHALYDQFLADAVVELEAVDRMCTMLTERRAA